MVNKINIKEIKENVNLFAYNNLDWGMNKLRISNALFDLVEVVQDEIVCSSN